MAPRASWKGYLKLSLVSCPIALYPDASSCDKVMVALGRVVLSRREHVMMLEAFDKGLLATTLHYSYEVRDQAPLFRGYIGLEIAG